MYIRKALIQEHSKEQILRIVDYIGSDEDRVKELMEIFFSEDTRLVQRSAWVLTHLSTRRPYLLRPYLPQMVKNLDTPKHDAVLRNTLRYFDMINLPEDLMGEVADKCFHYLNSPEYPIAIRVFSMGTLYNISLKFPELQRELILVIKEHLPFGSAGFKSRAKRILRKIDK
ncbi:MAG: hypothetical protein R8P61_30975 [Bacteroidia bacterium]|nr:hypothetical protein [Bacteroidia bacterium]